MVDSAARPYLLVLTPVHNEEENLERYVAQVTTELLDRPELDGHVLFVDDGSADGSWKAMRAVCERDPRFRAIRLSRNFGAHTALTAGMAEVGADVDIVATLAADLQDPPAVISEMVDRWKAGAKIVWGVRRTREDAGWRVLTSRLFQQALARYAMPRGSQFATGSFFLVDRQVVSAFQQFGERNRITFALVAWTGFDQDRVLYDRRRREAGVSGWNFGGMMRAMYDAFMSFSTLPTRLMRIVALLAFGLALLLMVYLLVFAVSGTNVPGWTSEMLLLSGFFAVQFSLLAIVGEYLQRIYSESIRRPLYFVSEEAGASDGPRSQGQERPGATRVQQRA